MQYLNSDIKWAAGVKDGRLLLNDLSRYRINIRPVNKVRGKNRYSLAALRRARIIGALQKLCIPMSHVNEMFDRICCIIPYHWPLLSTILPIPNWWNDNIRVLTYPCHF